jgi:hypothetical protein
MEMCGRLKCEVRWGGGETSYRVAVFTSAERVCTGGFCDSSGISAFTILCIGVEEAD